MIIKAILAASTTGICISAHASQASYTPQAAVTEMIVVSKAIEMRSAMSALTALHDTVMGHGENAKVIQIPYSLSTDTIWALTDDLAALSSDMVVDDDGVGKPGPVEVAVEV